MIYGYIRTSRAAVDGLAAMHPETQVQALAEAGVETANIVSDVGVSGSVPAGDRPGWTGLDARLLRGDTLTVAALDRISRNRVELVAVVESLHQRWGGHRLPGSVRVLAEAPGRPPHRGRADDGRDHPAGDGLGGPGGAGVSISAAARPESGGQPRKGDSRGVPRH